MIPLMECAALLAALTIACSLAAQEPRADAITEPGRTLERALAVALAGPAGEGERTLVLVVDATPALVEAGFADHLARALEDGAPRLAETSIAVAIVGSGDLAARPTTDRAAVVDAVRTALATPARDVRNVYAGVRDAVAAFGGRSGVRRMLLVSLENGDAEDDLEGTVQRLQRAKVSLSVIGSESFLADCYWQRNRHQPPPRGCELTGGDAPFVDLPWGWLFQGVPINEVTPSGFALYGVNRLAGATGGRVFLYAPASAAAHRCGVYGSCLFCSGDHEPAGEAYSAARLVAFAPSTESRADAYRSIGADPWFRATLRAWESAAREGLIQGTPPVRAAGTSSVKPDRARPGRLLELLGSLQFERHAARADEAAGECARVLERLDDDVARLVQDDRGLPRERAIAELTQVMLQLTKVNLRTFAGWCREVAPGLVDEDATVSPPEIDGADRSRRPVSIWFTELSLCHGVAPFFDVDLPGGEALRGELAELDRRVAAFAERYANTPFLVAVRRAGIARFHLTYPGIAGVPPPRPRSGSSSDDGPVTPGATRPVRTGAGSSGATTGPTTGGGR